MRVSLESGEGLQRHLLIDIPAEQVNQAVDEKLSELATQVRLDGFRPGKVPVKVVKQRFGSQVRQDVYAELIQSTFQEAVEQQELMPAGEPSIELTEAEETDGFGYKATFDVVPTPELSDLSGQSLQRPVAEMADSDLDEMIEKLRTQRATLEDVDRAAQDGDTLYIDFLGEIDGEAFAGGKGEDVPLELGSGAMIDGFESGLLGAQVGEERTVEVVFPEDYRAEHLAGKAASFTVKVNRVTEKKLPEIDAEFNKSYGVDDDTEESLRAEVRKNMQLELGHKLKDLYKNNALDLLQASNPLDIPQALIDREAERIKQQMMQEMQMQGQQTSYNLPASIFADQAKKRVHLGLLSAEVIKQQAFEVTEDELRQFAETLSQSYQNPSEIVDFYMDNAAQRERLKDLILEDKVVDWISSQVSVQEEPKSFSEVMEPKPADSQAQ